MLHQFINIAVSGQIKIEIRVLFAIKVLKVYRFSRSVFYPLMMFVHCQNWLPGMRNARVAIIGKSEQRWRAMGVQRIAQMDLSILKLMCMLLIRSNCHKQYFNIENTAIAHYACLWVMSQSIMSHFRLFVRMHRTENCPLMHRVHKLSVCWPNKGL